MFELINVATAIALEEAASLTQQTEAACAAANTRLHEALLAAGPRGGQKAELCAAAAVAWRADLLEAQVSAPFIIV